MTRRVNFTLIVLLALLSLSVASNIAVGSEAQGSELIKNGGFEEGLAYWDIVGYQYAAGGYAPVTLSLDRHEGEFGALTNAGRNEWYMVGVAQTVETSDLNLELSLWVNAYTSTFGADGESRIRVVLLTSTGTFTLTYPVENERGWTQVTRRIRDDFERQHGSSESVRLIRLMVALETEKTAHSHDRYIFGTWDEVSLKQLKPATSTAIAGAKLAPTEANVEVKELVAGVPRPGESDLTPTDFLQAATYIAATIIGVLAGLLVACHIASKRMKPRS